MAILKLLRGVSLSNEYKHTIDFDTLEAQTTYFSNLSYLSSDKFMQIKDTTASIFKTFLIQQTASVLRCEIPIDEARKCNYLMFKNDDDDKWYYGFLKQSYYLNEATTIIEYEIDVMQTFLFDFNIKTAFVEREHQDRWERIATNVYGALYNIQPENINLGTDYKITKYTRICDYDGNQISLVWACFLFTQNDLGGTYSLGTLARVNKFMSNSSLFACFVPIILGVSNEQPYTHNVIFGTSTLTRANDFLEYFATCPYLVSCEILPYLPNTNDFEIEYDTDTNTFTIDTSDYNVVNVGSFNYLQYINNDTITKARYLVTMDDYYQSKVINISTNDLANIDYEPKLHTYPYSYVMLQSNNATLDIKYEDLTRGYGYRSIMGKMSYYGYVVNQMYVDNYMGDTSNLYNTLIDKSINELPIKTDAYIQYLYTQHAQAQNQMAMGLIKGGSQLGIGLLASAMGTFGGATGNPFLVASGIGMVASGVPTTVDAVSSKLAKEDDLRTTPQELQKYGNDGTFGLLSKSVIPTLFYLQVKDEYRNIAYNYFRCYGYRSNRHAFSQNDLGLKSRYYYNYIKLADCDLELGYNKDYHDKIVQVLKSGITFWHNRTSMQSFNMFNYDYENWEVSLL